MGLNGVIIFEFVSHPEEEGKILGTAIVMRFITGIICTVIFIILICFTDKNNTTILYVGLIQAIQLPFLALDTFNYWYQSKLISKYAVIAQTSAFIIVSLYKVFLLITHKGVEWFAFSVSLSVIVVGMIYLVSYEKRKQYSLGFSKEIVLRLLRGCGPFILANMMVVIYGQMDRVMIKQILNSTSAVGLYSAAMTICGLIAFIPTAILDSGRPVVMEAKLNDESTYQLRTRQLFAGLFWISCIYSIGVTIFSKFILNLLYGSAYLAANNSVRIGAWYTTFAYLGSARNTWLICEKQNRFVFIFSCFGVASNFLMNYFLIPIYGIDGAAFATFLTEVLVCFVYPSFFRSTKQYSACVIDAILLRNIELKKVFILLKKKIKNIVWRNKK